MDNRKFLIQSEGPEAFKLAMRLVFDGAPGGKATHYAEENGTLVLFWHDECEATELPYPLDAERAGDFCWQWLKYKAVRKAPYDDGDVENGDSGFRVETSDWGKVTKLGGGSYTYAKVFFCRITAIYSWYGK